MKIEYYIYRVMSDGFEDLSWNGNSLIGYIRWLRQTKDVKNKISNILIRGLWMPKHLTAVSIRIVHSAEAIKIRQK